MATPEEDFAQPDTEEVTENEHSQDQGHLEETGASAGEKKWPGWPGESVFRILVPSQKVGGIIGRKGELVKKMCEESRARIKVLDSPLNVPEKAVMVSAKEEPDTLISPAMDGLLRVLKHVIGSIDELSHPTIAGSMALARLLVPATQVGILIGKQGSTIKSVQEASHANIHVCDDLPPFALQDDRVVEIKGEPARVYKAVELIASHLRKFLVDRSVLPRFELHMPMLHPHMEQNMAPPQRWGHPQGIPMNTGGTGYGGSTQFVPPLPNDNFYPPSDLPPLEKQPHYGISAYGREPPPMGVQLSANQQPPPRISQVTQHMQIPLSYADAVIGSAGSTISYIRRASGATITIQETRGVPGEMTVEINGSATQVQTAQQLIQNFMAEAAATAAAPAAAPAHNSMPPADQGYNSYSTYGSRYASPRANAGVASYASGGYGSGYGGSYGY